MSDDMYMTTTENKLFWDAIKTNNKNKGLRILN